MKPRKHCLKADCVEARRDLEAERTARREFTKISDRLIKKLREKAREGADHGKPLHKA